MARGVVRLSFILVLSQSSYDSRCRQTWLASLDLCCILPLLLISQGVLLDLVVTLAEVGTDILFLAQDLLTAPIELIESSYKRVSGGQVLDDLCFN